MDVKITSFFMSLLDIKSLIIEKIIGNIKSAKQKSIITFGIIKESLFNPGVMIKVTAMVLKTKIFGILLILILCTLTIPLQLG